MTVSETERLAREVYWRTRLRRLRFDAEPLAVQVGKYRRTTQVLSGVIGIVALMFLAIFLSFGRPDVAIVMMAIIFGPIVVISWWDFKKLERSFLEYQKEKASNP